MKTEAEIEAEELERARAELENGNVPQDTAEFRARRTRDAAERLRKGFWQKQAEASPLLTVWWVAPAVATVLAFYFGVDWKFVAACWGIGLGIGIFIRLGRLKR